MIHARFSISTMMLVVLVLALDLFAGGPFYGPTGMEAASLFNSGVLPMVSILAIGSFVLMHAQRVRQAVGASSSGSRHLDWLPCSCTSPALAYSRSRFTSNSATC